MSTGNSDRKHSWLWILAGASAGGAALFALGHWYLQPVAHEAGDLVTGSANSLLDTYLPESEFNGQVSVVIHTPPRAIFQALQEVRLDDMPLAKWLGQVRYLPGRLLGKSQGGEATKEPFMKQVLGKSGGNLILEEEPARELVFGAIGKFHKPIDQQIVPLSDSASFMRFDRPDYQKLAMSIRVIATHSEAEYRLILEHRTHALSPSARRKFALYWLAIKPGGNLVSWLMLRAIKQRAESSLVGSVKEVI